MSLAVTVPLPGPTDVATPAADTPTTSTWSLDHWNVPLPPRACTTIHTYKMVIGYIEFMIQSSECYQATPVVKSLLYIILLVQVLR